LIDRSQAGALVLACLSDILIARQVVLTEPLTDTTRLLGGDTMLDSLGLVELIVDVEQRLEAELGVAVTLADERAMSLRQSPFRTVDTLADYICVLAAEQNGKASA